jgi:hypothetical protein
VAFHQWPVLASIGCWVLASDWGKLGSAVGGSLKTYEDKETALNCRKMRGPSRGISAGAWSAFVTCRVLRRTRCDL